jgi:hypothetical protein
MLYRSPIKAFVALWGNSNHSAGPRDYAAGGIRTESMM